MKTTIFYSFLFSLGLTTITVKAQESANLTNFCASEIPSRQWEDQFQSLVKETKSSNSAKKSQVPLYTIPVIIHVIHGGQQPGTYPNLAQGQLNSQIRVLNDDFGGIGFNSGNYNPQAFANWASSQGISVSSLDAFGRVKIANCNVQFCLATRDTLGNILPEPGIDRVNYVSRGWTNPASQNSYNGFKNLIDNTIKPQTVWNVSRYLNIWVTDENVGAVGLLGYATFPPLTGLAGLGSGGTATTDGFWCYARAFGSVDYFPSGYYSPNNNRGRTSTHELGHYFGLRHIWGDGTCANDYCDDTPPATDKNFYSPSYPFKTSGCSGNNPDGEMFMNFMDYTNDDIKYMFTEDQAARLQTAMANSPYRQFLGTHNLCSVAPIAANAKFKMPLSVCGTSAAITITNQTIGTPVPSYTWNISGGATLNPNVNAQIAAISFPSPGIYTLSLTADNGTLSTSSQTFTVYQPSLTVTGASQFVCDGADITLTASGGNYYSWAPLGITSPTYSFVASGISSFTVLSVSAGSCRTMSIVEIASMDCSGLSSASLGGSAFTLAPNPTTGNIYISQSAHAVATTITLSDVTGKVLFTEEMAPGTDQVQMNAGELNPGIYFVQFKTNGTITGMKKLIRQ